MFDLWPILQEQERVSEVMAGNQLAKLLKQSFCPACRQAVLMGLPEQNLDLDAQEETEFEAKASAEVTDDTEYELALDYE